MHKWILGYLFYPDSLMQKSLTSRTKNSHKAGTLGWETFFPSSCRLTTKILEKQTHLWSLPQTNKGTCQIAFNTDIILEKTDANGIYGHFWYARLMMIIFVVHSILIFYWTQMFGWQPFLIWKADSLSAFGYVRFENSSQWIHLFSTSKNCMWRIGNSGIQQQMKWTTTCIGLIMVIRVSTIFRSMFIKV